MPTVRPLLFALLPLFGGCQLLNSFTEQPPVSEPRFPCFKFDAAIGFAQASRLMVQSAWCGSYLAVIQPAQVCAGDPFELIPGRRDVGLRALFRARARA